MLPNEQLINLLLSKLYAGQISRDELNRLYELIHASDNAEALQSSLLQQLEQQHFDEEELLYWKQRLSTLPAKITETPLQAQRPLRSLLPRLTAAAAIVLLLIGVSLYYLKQSAPEKPPIVHRQQPPADIQPGSNRAMLTLSDGSRVALDAAGSTIRDGELAIRNNNGHLEYPDNQRFALNTMSTPKGGQYQLQLADGSKIWLNAASSVTFPTAFPGNTREIKVSGEVYLEVARNAKKPFTVICGSQRIDVLGTAFNINAYPDEKGTVTTLINGAVRVSTNTHPPVTLKPHEQAVVNQTIQIKSSVNTEQVLAWKNGSFNFGGQDFAASMRQLERWYNIQVVYDNGIPTETLGGEIDRNMTLGQVLKLLDGIVAKFRLEGNTLHVMASTN